MKKIISLTLSAAIAAGIFASSPSVYGATADSMAGIVSTSGSRLNVRSGASAESTVITSLNKSTYVTLISKSGEWWKVEFADGRFGYCHEDYIDIASENTASVATNTTNLNVRSGAGKSYPVIGTLKKGENVIILSSNGYWARVLYDGTKTGCVSTDYLLANRASGYSPVSLSVPDFKQTDSRWASVKIGSSGKTIGRIGCVTTGIAMIESYRSKTTVYPHIMMKNLSYDSAGNVYWPSDYVPNYWSENYLEVIYNRLKAGQPVLVGAKTSRGNQHWVVVTGFSGGEKLSPSGFTINDPGSSVNKNLGQFFAEFPYLYKFFYYN